MDFFNSDVGRRFTKNEKLELYKFLRGREFNEKLETLKCETEDFLNMLMKEYVVDKDIMKYLEENPNCESLCRMGYDIELDMDTLTGVLDRDYDTSGYTLTRTYLHSTLSFNVDPFPINMKENYPSQVSLLAAHCPEKLLNILCDMCLSYIDVKCEYDNFLWNLARYPYFYSSIEDREYFYKQKTWLDLYLYKPEWYSLFKKHCNKNCENENKLKLKYIQDIEKGLGL